MSAKLHYNSVASGIDENVMKERRFAHNRVKTGLLNEAMFFSGIVHSKKATVLDLACGRGGDLPKFKHYELDYHAVDIADQALDEARRRFGEMGLLGTFHPYAGDAADVSIPLHGTADVAIVNFALHYFTDSEEHCTRLLQRVAKALRPGGVFCGVYARARHVPMSPYTTALHWPTPGEIEAFPWGHRYEFDMPPFVHAEEYMVPMDNVIHIAHANGLLLMKDRGISEYALSIGLPAEHIDRMYGVFMFIRV